MCHWCSLSVPPSASTVHSRFYNNIKESLWGSVMSPSFMCAFKAEVPSGCALIGRRGHMKGMMGRVCIVPTVPVFWTRGKCQVSLRSNRSGFLTSWSVNVVYGGSQMLKRECVFHRSNKSEFVVWWMWFCEDLMRSFDFRMWVQYVSFKPHVRNWRHDFSLLSPPNMFFIQTFCLSLERLLARDTGECFRLFEKVNAAEDVQFRCFDCDRRFVWMFSRNAADMPTISQSWFCSPYFTWEIKFSGQC